MINASRFSKIVGSTREILTFTMSMRRKVLLCYRALNRTSREVFRGDHDMLEASKKKIKEEFSKNILEKDPSRIEELVKTAEEAEEVLRRLIVQGIRKPNGTYRLNFTENTVLEDNAPLPKG